MLQPWKMNLLAALVVSSLSTVFRWWQHLTSMLPPFLSWVVWQSMSVDVFDSMLCSVEGPKFLFHKVHTHHVKIGDIVIKFKINGWYCKPCGWYCNIVQTIWLDGVRTTVFHSMHHTLIKWCSAHKSFSFHTSHAHQVMQCAKQFFVPRITRSSSDAVRTKVFRSTHHTLIKWCSAHNSFSFHTSHAHQVMQCAQQFFILTHLTLITWCTAHKDFFVPQCTRSSSDAVRTTVFHSTHLTLIKWCSAHNRCSFSFHASHAHHVMHCAQEFFVPQCTHSSRPQVPWVNTIIPPSKPALNSARNELQILNNISFDKVWALTCFNSMSCSVEGDGTVRPNFCSTRFTLITWK